MAIIKQAVDDENIYTLDSKINNIILKDKNKEYCINSFKDKSILDTYIWGIPIGKTARNSNLVEEMKVGDIVFFGRKNTVDYIGRVGTTSFEMQLTNEQTTRISNDFWGKPRYELLYFLDEVIKINCDMTSFNTFFDYNETAMFRGVSKIANATNYDLENTRNTVFRMWAQGIIKSNEINEES